MTSIEETTAVAGTPDNDQSEQPKMSMTTSGAPRARLSKKQQSKVIAASFVGTTLEYYEFFIYGTMAALVFSKLFFPDYSSFAGTLASFATFAIGFVARPVGSILFGHFGDKLGRKNTLMLSLGLMGVGTFLIGVLPGFATIGIAAPILLVVLRLAQGLALGGEWGGAALMLVENAGKGRKGVMGSVVQMGVPAGLLLASGVTSLAVAISGGAFLEWGWRIPFLASAVLVGVATYVRLAVDESPEFVKALDQIEKEPRVPIGTVLRKNWSDLLLILGVAAPGNAVFFVVSTYTLSYATTALGVDRGPVLLGQSVASVIYFFTIPLFGLLADKIGEWKVVLIGSIGAGVWAYIYFALLNTRNTFLIFIAMGVALAFVHAALQAPQAALFSSRFPVEVRYTGVALGQAIPTTLIGGTVPFLATLFLEWTGSTVLISAYMLLLAIVGVVCAVLFSRRNHNRVDD